METRTISPSIAASSDDRYNTRQHAFNIGLAYFAFLVAACVCSTIIFELKVIWILRGVLASFMIGMGQFARSLICFTNEARDIQWESSMPKAHIQEIPIEQSLVQRGKSAFPSPDNKNGRLFTTVHLSEYQKHSIASAAVEHGKLTINFLTGLGVQRDGAERLREDLCSHSLLKFNERGEALVTAPGLRSFKAMLQ